ncbi:MAG: TauD/TfdA family dioxygenase [Gammaproteobacteria bacterium]
MSKLAPVAESHLTPGNGRQSRINEALYQRWRDYKLERYAQHVEDLAVEIRDPCALTRAEREALVERCRSANMAIYDCGRRRVSKEMIATLGAQLGLHKLDPNPGADADRITSLQVGDRRRGDEYIPYTNRSLNWHTDGYYNSPSRQVRAFLMHCVRPAARGGANAFLDTDIAYLLMRDRNPAYVDALSHPWALTIPPNTRGGVEIRPARTGPVFSVDDDNTCLHMRYTARRQNAHWREDAVTRAATGFLELLLNTGSEYVLEHRLEAGQGVICNNVLHRRTTFQDDREPGHGRLLYRARYHDRIRDTNCTTGAVMWSGGHALA